MSDHPHRVALIYLLAVAHRLVNTLKSHGDDDATIERVMAYRDALAKRIAAGEEWEINF